MRQEDILEGLNKQQLEAVTSTEGPMLLLAGAGSGKTRVITHRIAYGLQQGTFRADQVLAVTFTNKAAGEMRERISNLSRVDFNRHWVKTFHSACAAILRREAPAFNYPRDFTIYDTRDQTALIKDILKKTGGSLANSTPAAILNKISRAQDSLLGPGDLKPRFDGDMQHEQLTAVYRIYQERLQEAKALDFGDLIFQTVRLFEEQEEILEKWRTRFPYLLIDEFQDTNKAQYTLMKQLAKKSRNVCVVGDDDQSIYSWRGADIHNIRSFQKDFQEAKIIRLEQNYRSTPQILEIASSVISNNNERMSKTLWSQLEKGPGAVYLETEDDREEAEAIAGGIRELAEQDTAFPDIAVFYRTNFQSRTIEECLMQREIPYRVIGSVRFYERKEVKDLLAYLRLAVNPYDAQAFERAASVPPRGIGARTRALLREKAAAGRDLITACEQSIAEGSIKGKRTVSGLKNLLLCLRAVQDAASVKDAVARGMEKSGLMQHYAEEEQRLGDLHELHAAADSFAADSPDEGLGEFLNRIALLGEMDKTDSATGVNLMTLHNAKGLEFDTVFIAGMEEGLFPHYLSADEQRRLEEERRLFYVGITRAKQRLLLSAASRRFSFGRTSYNEPSRFLNEIPESLCEKRGGAFLRTPRLRAAKPHKNTPEATVTEDQSSPGFREGERVSHPRYGEGVITRRTGPEVVARVQVAFRERSCLFLERYSNLTSLEKEE